ncbi:collagenase [Trinickia sp. Y13]|uniref:collagenase n=1 Tax=Trinickia sp. Y13 TaxID=2917807 RepID=UPI002406250A|nr:collagenase [Trinickia sp. Y13]MDG0024454.1 collagenase [Trinickia sp. Y13]
MMADALAHSTMAGADRFIWLNAAQAAKAYDDAHCSFYKTCNFETALMAAHSSEAISVRRRYGAVAIVDPEQARAACGPTAQETAYFHTMLATSETPIRDDHDTTFDAVVFADREAYHHYSPVFFSNVVDNGGVYLEGDSSLERRRPGVMRID